MNLIRPDWPAPAGIHAWMTTRHASETEVEALLPTQPAWLKQVHGTQVVDLDSAHGGEGDAAITTRKNRVCAIRVADCMPVLMADEEATVVAAAHAGWRGLSAGVLETTVEAIGLPGEKLLAWLGPAIGPRVYEVGDEVRAAFKEKEAFTANRPGHWLLDLYAVARRRLEEKGVQRIFGGGFCTYSDPQRFHSYRRDGTSGRMAAFIWLA